MQEKVITIYDVENFEIKALVILRTTRTIVFGGQPLVSDLSAHIERLGKTSINTTIVKETLTDMARKRCEYAYLVCLEPFALESDNKNASSRYKNMLRKMNLSHFERKDIKYDRKKNVQD